MPTRAVTGPTGLKPQDAPWMAGICTGMTNVPATEDRHDPVAGGQAEGPTSNPAPDAAAKGSHGHPKAASKKIGPNAILQTGETLRDRFGSSFRDGTYAAAALEQYLTQPPSSMIDEEEPARLFATITSRLPDTEAHAVLEEAGNRTGDYILANRIPAPAKTFFRYLPRGLAARALLWAIHKHAWTFAGSAKVSCKYFGSPTLSITDNPLATSGCPWHCGVLQRLFARLAGSETRIVHTRTGNTDCFKVYLK